MDIEGGTTEPVWISFELKHGKSITRSIYCQSRQVWEIVTIISFPLRVD